MVKKVTELIGITGSHKFTGIGEYSNSINKIIPVYSIILNKHSKNREYIGTKLYTYYPPITTGWALNSILTPIHLHLHSFHKVHYLEPFNPLSIKKGIVTIHDTYFLHRGILNEKYLDIINRLFHKWKIISPSQNTKNELIKYLHYNSEQITVIPNPVNPIFKITSQLDNEDKPIDLLTVGDGMHKHNKDIRYIANKLGLKHIHIGKDLYQNNFTNISNEELYNFYKHSKVAIRFSDIEGFGYPAIQSIYSGTPIILSDIPTFKEIMPNNYPLFIKSLSDFEEAYYKALNFKINFNESWYSKYSIDTFIKTMKDYYMVNEW